ncbi:alpha/beta hydrolase [Catenovulum sp. 2E275]|uniref:alpha/beta fold hydrolase n=1 Tax=Catenovulum sp. 2E275 TaxID=2980497 RepID=UPI0021D05662|nr:alpha/beta hydrolase [Catenovulum sp. 2E275]MCU4677360.1 alpha/beta hydrolase [Catenovulum sp. 2E275]
MNTLIQAGHSSAILLIRGLMREQGHWFDFAEILSAELPNLPILKMDIAGNGTEYHGQTPQSISLIREELANRFTQNYPNIKTLYLVSISMGGMIAADWANAEPDKIKKIVLINSSFAGLLPFYQRLKWQNYFSLLKLPFLNLSSKEALIFSLTTNLICYPQSTEIVKKWINLAQQHPVANRNILRQLWAAARFRLPENLTVPTLIFGSERDKLVDVKASMVLEQKWDNSSLYIHPKAGHDLPLDDSEWLAPKIAQFIKED